MIATVTVTSNTGYISNWQNFQKTLNSYSGILASAPYATAEVLLSYSGGVQAALLTGILPDEEKNMSSIANKMVQGKMTDLVPGKFGIVVGENLASVLGVGVGDKVTVVTPEVSVTPAGVIPRFKRFTVIGIFRAGGGFGFDRAFGYIHLSDAQRLLNIGNDVTGIHLNIKDVYTAPEFARELRGILTPTASVSTWADQFGEFFHAIKMEKTMMFLMLLLILAVAAFNMVSSLVMVVNEKEPDIAILRTFGATPGMIMTIFVIQGGLVGIFGTLIGGIGGIALAWNVTAIEHWIEKLFHVQFLSSNVYFVNYLPSQILVSDVVTICGFSLLLSLIATIYPAWRAAKMDPVESLRYE